MEVATMIDKINDKWYKYIDFSSVHNAIKGQGKRIIEFWFVLLSIRLWINWSFDMPCSSLFTANSYVGVGILAGLLGLMLVMLAGTCWMYRKQELNTAYRPIPLTEEPWWRHQHHRQIYVYAVGRGALMMRAFVYEAAPVIVWRTIAVKWKCDSWCELRWCIYICGYQGK